MSLRKDISEILVRHSMPTRQVAINDILKVIAQLIREGMPKKKVDVIGGQQIGDASAYNHGIDDSEEALLKKLEE